MTPRRLRFEKPTVVTTIRPDQFEPREPAAVLLKQQPGSIVVLNGGRVDYDPHFAYTYYATGAAVDLRRVVLTRSLRELSSPFSTSR
jgi:hypothetical protein